MFRIASARFVGLLTASLLVAAPAALHAQKALVYCPVGIDASGCNAIVTALNASPTPFPGGVDGGYDGTQGTVDLATADLSGYAVFVVPSLADGPDVQPYGLLRDGTVAARLQAAFMGRVAVWSGTPDVGSTNRSAKDGLIRNLASWARPDSAGTHGPGVVALQDNSDDGAARYGWLGSISSMSVLPDTTFDVYSNVQVLTATGQQILTNSSGLQIGYTNMASYGLVRGSGVAATDDATGGRSTRVVLVTMQGDPSDPNIATVSTDREDYFPPDTVLVTGAGWQPGETVSLLFQEDVNPPIEPNVTLSAIADDAGHILNQEFVIDSADIGVRFTLTATGQSSGRTAQATFTDAGTKIVKAQTAVSPVAATVSARSYAGSGTCTGASTTIAGSPFSIASAAATTITSSNLSGQSVKLTASATATAPSGSAFINWTTGGSPVTPIAGDNLSICVQGTNGNQTDIFTPVYATTSTSLTSSVSTTNFGQSVTFTATVTSLIGGTATGTVTFNDGGSSIGTGTLSGGQATLSTTALAVGSHTITADYAGSGNFTPSTSAALSHTVNKANQTISFTSTAPAAAVVGGTAYTAAATATSGLTVSFSSLTPLVCTSSGTNGATINFIAVGTCTVAGDQAGNTNYNPAPQATQGFAVGKGSQTITFTSTAPAAAVFGGPAYTVTATGGASGNPVLFSSLTTGVCTSSGTNGATINFIAAGTCTVAANQSGNANYNDATQATQTFTVGKANQTIAFDLSTLPAKTFGDADFSVASYVTGFGASGNPVTFASGSPTRCTVSSVGLVHISTATGNCMVTASQAGNANYNAAPDVNQTFNVAKAGQTITFTSTAPVGAFVGGPTYLAAATATSGLTVAFGTSTPLVCSSTGTNGATITMVGGGSCIVTANQIGNGDYLAATQVTQSFAVTAQQAQTISFTSTAPSNAKVAGATYTAAATATSGLTVSFSSLTTLVCTSSGATFTFIAVGDCTVAANQPGNASFLVAPQVTQTFAVGKGDQTISFAALGNKTYGDADFGVSATASSGLTVTFAASGECTVAATTVHITGAGSCTITASQAGNANYNAATDVDRGFTINQAAVAPHFAADNKVYNGNTSATILTRSLTGVLGTDDVSLDGGSASFIDKDVGNGKTVNASGFTLGGADKDNYVLSPATASTTANITQRDLTVAATGINKVYNGNTSATVTLSDDRVSGDVFTDSYTSASFLDKNVGNGKTVNVSGIAISGTDAGNYNLTNTTAATLANITPATVDGHFTADNKVYNGNTSATILTRSLTGVIGTDDVSLTGGSASFVDKNVGNGKLVNGTGFSLTGADMGNYELASSNITSAANITHRDLTVAATGINKVYNGNTSATVTLSDDRVSGDVFTDSYTSASFLDKNVGNGKTVNVSGIAISGTDAGNYNPLNTAAATTANITVAPLTPHFTADNKGYNGNTDATILTRTLSGVFPGDVVSLTGGTASFDTKHVGTGKTVTGSGFGLAGGDAGNYELNPTSATTTADITVRTLTVTATGINKVYDQTTTATVTLADDRLGGDLFGLSYTANFNTKDVGTGKPVSVTAITIGAGAEADDYVLGNTTTATTADITPRPITVTATGINKLLDGNTSATVTLSATPLAGDVIAPLTYASAAFATPTAGLNKPVNVTGIALTGVDKDNYLANTTAATTANITYTTLYGHKFLQPVNLYPDPKSAFKINSTIPVKFQLFQADGVTPVSGAVATISTLKLSSSAPDGINEDVVSTVADQGVTFRYDAAGKQYIFNLGTKSWTQGGYRLIATLDDGSTITADIEAKTK